MPNQPRIFVAFAITLFASLGLAHAAEEQPSQIVWTDDAELAATLSREAQLPVLVYATSEHCGYCRKMERDTLAHPGIIQRVEEGFIPLRIDSKRDAQLVARIGIRAYPTTVLISPEGRLLTGAAGYQSPNEFADLLNKVQTAEARRQTAGRAR